MSAYKVGDVFIDVVTNSMKALEDLKKFNAELLATVDVADAVIQTTDKLRKAQEDGSTELIKMLKEQLRLQLEKIKLTETEIDKARQLRDVSLDTLKKTLREEKKRARQLEITMTEAMRREAAFTDYAGTQAEQRLRRGEQVSKKELRNIEGFLTRAASEHSRYADRLDRRDMTSSVFQNISRGMQKGFLISERWHKDENALQKFSRGLGIAGASLQRVRSHAEVATDAFYKLQRITYILQSGLSTLLGSIGALVGGLMGLVGVAGAAAASLVAVGSAMLSVVSGFVAGRIGFGKIGNAVGQAWQQQSGYNKSLQEARRQLRALKFDAEEAALSEQEAAISLEKAREELARVQDLPPDSRVRREVELQFQQAELAYRRAKARNQEVREDLAKANKNPMSLLGGGGGGQDPFAGLTASQKKFAKYLVTLRPVFTKFRESVASQFLGPLEAAFRTIIKDVFPTLEQGMAKVAGGMGRAIESFANAAANPENLRLLANFFTNSVPTIEKFGDAMGYAFGGLLAMLQAAKPLTDRFSQWISDSAKNFENWAKSGLNDGTLTKFYNLAGDVAASLGDVFGNIFDGIRNIINATFPGGNINAGAGGVILRWLNSISSGFKAFTGNSAFAAWLEQTSTTATVALSTVGDFLHILLDLAAQPELQTFWQILQGALVPVKSILMDGVKAAPAFGNLLVSIAKILAVMSESGAISLFMDSLATMIEFFAGILEAIEPALTAIGRFHAVILAITGIGLLFKAFGIIFFGAFEKIFSTVGNASKRMFTFNAQIISITQTFKKMQTATSTLADSGLTGLAGKAQKARQTMYNLGTSIWSVTRNLAAKKNHELLLQVARNAGVADDAVEALNLELERAIRNGNTTVATMRRAAYKSATATGNELALGAMNTAGLGGSGKLLGGGRFAAGATSALSIVGSMGTMFSGTMNSAAAQIAGSIGLFGSMIPGLPGLIIGALGGLSSIVINAVEGARLQAEAKIDNIKEIAANQINTQKIIEEQNTGIAQKLISAGLSPAAAGKATEGLKLEARKIAATPEAAATNLGAKGIKDIINQLLTQGGAETAKILSDPTSKKAQDLINSAVNVAMSTRNVSSKGLTAEGAAAAAAAALANLQSGGSPIGRYRNLGGVVKTGEAAFTAAELNAGGASRQGASAKAATLYPKYISALESYVAATAPRPGIGAGTGGTYTPPATDPRVKAATDALNAAREAYMKNPIMQGKGIVLDNKDPIKTQLVGTEGIKFSDTKNTVKLANANDFILINKTLGIIATNTGTPMAPPSVSVTVDEKFLKNAGWKKTG